MTQTRGEPATRHVDVSLWFALEAHVDQVLTPDPGEFAAVRWWNRAEIAAGDPGSREPHLVRALDTVGLG